MFDFNSVQFSILGVPAYFFCAGIAIVAAAGVFIALLVSKGYSIQDNTKILFPAALMTVGVARVFGMASAIVRDISSGDPITFSSVLDSGIVFFGGLLGFLLAFFVGLKVNREDHHVLDIVSVPIPLFHAIARVGCFLGGCCYGVESSTCISVRYTTLVSGELTTAERIPVQLIESAFNVLLFFYLLLQLLPDDWKERALLKKYLLLYSLGRFLLEFIRGDLHRGVLMGISFSQLICIGIWTFLLIQHFASRHKKEKTI